MASNPSSDFASVFSVLAFLSDMLISWKVANCAPQFSRTVAMVQEM